MLGFLQAFLDWIWNTADWLNSRSNWIFLIAVFGLGLLYFAFKHRR